eukprot:CAMPEP_0113712698 /NCGR_PEP_ID=MMETSP0038_2-20120614/31537_1 /TAXON_ID=2898 /ORGANISM="Cryptomonas paramecium" /LENGTH=92 /DNA_ID=CAMNT_0000639255 /DNA_START=230 /DNA_END=508 /DNA_ORIENTATION=- /assembly_acc=CAM_ASM_000170
MSISAFAGRDRRSVEAAAGLRAYRLPPLAARRHAGKVRDEQHPRDVVVQAGHQRDPLDADVAQRGEAAQGIHVFPPAQVRLGKVKAPNGWKE